MISQKHSNQARINIAKAREHLKGKPPWNKKDKIKLLCTYCGKEYQVHECEARRSPDKHFCSHQCASQFKTTVRGIYHPLWKRQIRKCEWCGKEVWVKPAKLIEFRFCSRQCVGSWTSANCKSPTKPEVIVQDAFMKLKLDFKSQYRIGKYPCDFVLPKHHIVIEVDGDYWHSTNKRKKLDQTKDKTLQSEGWRIIRLKESDIYHNLPKCLIRVAKYISLFP
jgi:very-short-patch-repair endonuclease